MATHDISLSILHGITILNTDIEVAVREDGDLLGRIRISRGTIDWIPARKHRGHRLGWRRFAELMEQNVKPTRLERRA
jgi:hypothetical protein